MCKCFHPSSRPTLIIFNLPTLTYADGTLRIVGAGTSPSSGRLEVAMGGTWGAVCNWMWGELKSQVACRQLGYQTGRALWSNPESGDDFLPAASGWFWSGGQFQCSGSEVQLTDCGTDVFWFDMSGSCAFAIGVECFVEAPPPPSLPPPTPPPRPPVPPGMEGETVWSA